MISFQRLRRLSRCTGGEPTADHIEQAFAQDRRFEDAAIKQHVRRAHRSGLFVPLRREKAGQMPRDAGVGFEGESEFAESAGRASGRPLRYSALREEAVEQQGCHFVAPSSTETVPPIKRLPRPRTVTD